MKSCPARIAVISLPLLMFVQLTKLTNKDMHSNPDSANHKSKFNPNSVSHFLSDVDNFGFPVSSEALLMLLGTFQYPSLGNHLTISILDTVFHHFNITQTHLYAIGAFL